MNDKPIENNQDSRDANGAQETERENRPFRPDYKLAARLVVRDGKTWMDSALEAGYSQFEAMRGLKNAMARSSALTQAIQAEYERITVSIDRLKPVAVTRLFREISDPESSNAIRAIEVAGKFKETDWFVRNSETNIGIFAQMVENTVIVDNSPDKFED